MSTLPFLELCFAKDLKLGIYKLKPLNFITVLWEAFSLNTDSYLTSPVPYSSPQSSKMESKFQEEHWSLLRYIVEMPLVKSHVL